MLWKRESICPNWKATDARLHLKREFEEKRESAKCDPNMWNARHIWWDTRFGQSTGKPNRGEVFMGHIIHKIKIICIYLDYCIYVAALRSLVMFHLCNINIGFCDLHRHESLPVHDTTSILSDPMAWYRLSMLLIRLHLWKMEFHCNVYSNERSFNFRAVMMLM
jgi:hypothetical protein